MHRLLLLAFCLFCLKIGQAQVFDFSAYAANWEGSIDSKALSIKLRLEAQKDNAWKVNLSNSAPFYEKTIKTLSNSMVDLPLGTGLHFKGEWNKDKSVISGFLQSETTIYHLKLKQQTNGTYLGDWYPFMVDELMPGKMFLYLGDIEGEDYQAYPFFSDNRYRGTYAGDFQKKDNRLFFKDFRAGIYFEATLSNDKINLDLKFGDATFTKVELEKSTSEWVFGTTAKSDISQTYKIPADKNDGWKVQSLLELGMDYSELQRMNDSIAQNTLTNVHSVLIAQNGKLIFENYYSGFHANIPHDQRSAAKSIGSAMIGIAINEGVIDNVEEPIYDYLPTKYQYTRNDKKAKMTLHQLLTMSSGLDAIDFGSDRMGHATEGYYQETEDWAKTILETPLLFEPGEHCNYGSAHPYLLGVGLANILDQPLDIYMQDRLYKPLGISHYSMPLDPDNDPYFGGGTYLIPRDMLKFGELYRAKGKWKGKQIVPVDWVEASFKKYTVLENTNNKNKYGYLWWHDTYTVKGKDFEAIEARGAGGQYICVIPKLDAVIVVTSGNYRNGRFWQPEMIIEDYVLPAMVR